MAHKLPCLVLLVMALGFCTAAQEHASSPQSPDKAPTVTFTLDRASGEPHRYKISVDSTGRASYQIAPAQTGANWVSEGSQITEGSRISQASEMAGDPPEIVKFTMDPATVGHVFELARQTNYFQGDFDYHKHRIADTGRKTLAYADAGRASQTEYNWSENSAIAELTKIFTGIAATLDFGPRLQYLWAHDKLGLDQELSSMESLADSGELAELQIVAPVLQQIASDPSIMNIARERARRILQHAGLPLSTSSAPD